MSLELAIERNTAAIERLVALLANPSIIAQAGTIDASDVETTEVEKPKAAKRTNKEAAPATAGKSAEEPSAPALVSGASDASAMADAAAATEAPTYEETAQSVIRVASKLGRAKAAEILAEAKPGAKSLRDVDPAGYSGVIRACEAALA